MKPISKIDATAALLIIFFLMISLLGTNTFYILTRPGHLEEALPRVKSWQKLSGR